MRTDKEMNRRVVITGVGPLSAIGNGKQDFWDGILNKRTGVVKEEISIENEHFESFYLHRINNFKITDYFEDSGKILEIRNWKNGGEVIDLYYLLAAVKLAIVDSHLVYAKESNRIGLILSHENPGINQFAEEMAFFSFDLLKSKKLSKKEYFKIVYKSFYKKIYDLQTFMFIFHIAKALDLHGCSYFINNACSSGLYALEVASSLIKSGQNTSVIVAAVDRPDFYKYLLFKELGMYASDGKIKPFAENADGFVFGDGGGAVVLEDFEHAVERGAEIYAEYICGSFSTQGWKVVYPAIKASFYKDAIENVLTKSGIPKSDIDLVVPHGVGTQITDRYEAGALEEIFGQTRKPFYSAFKPYIGHCLGGSTLLETIILLLAIKNQIIPPLLNCEQKSRHIKIDFVKDFFAESIDIAIKTSVAFAGFDAAVVLKRVIL